MIGDRIKRTLCVGDKEIADTLHCLLAEGLRKRGENLIEFDPLADDFTGSSRLVEPEAKLRYSIEQADLWRRGTTVDLRLRAAQSLTGRLLERVRRPLHELVVFYLKLMAERQDVFNAHALTGLRLLFETVQRRAKEPGRQEAAELRAEVDLLRGRIVRLEEVIAQLTEEREGQQPALSSGPLDDGREANGISAGEKLVQ